MQLTPFRRRGSHPVTLRDAMNQLFDESFWDPFDLFGRGSLLPGGWRGEGAARYVPSVDIAETGKEVTVRADLPGYEPDKIDVQIEDGVLTMSGEMREEKEEDRHRKWYRRECACGSFFQRFALPGEIEEDKVKCTFRNGKLTVTVPKKAGAEERKAGKKLTIDVE